MEHRWNEIDKENPKYSKKNLSQCHFVHHKTHKDWPGIEPGFCGERPVTNRLSHGTAMSTNIGPSSLVIQPFQDWN
jgi:hypothetical protein